MLTVLFLSFSPLYAQRSWKNKSSVACTHCALCSAPGINIYLFILPFLQYYTILSLSIILIPVHLDFFSFAAGAFVLRQSESGWKATVRENIVYWLIVCSFVPCSASSFFTAQNTRGHIIRYNLRALCTKVEWQAQQDYCLFYDTWPRRDSHLPSTPTGCDVVVCQRRWHAQGP